MPPSALWRAVAPGGQRDHVAGAPGDGASATAVRLGRRPPVPGELGAARTLEHVVELAGGVGRGRDERSPGSRTTKAASSAGLVAG